MGKLSEAEYIAIKQLLAKGYNGKKVAEIVERGQATVSDVKNSQDFNDYREKQAEVIKARKAKKPAEQLKLDVPGVPLDGDKRADIFVAFNKVIDTIYEYQASLDDLGILSQMEVKAIEIATQKIEEARFWLKEYL